ncbi:MAG: HAMP domain-containing histidine kinase [Oligoflexia bacterium]|nr:HAMP domain-containing histidine kinase [Oligoflexia bacterium]
MSKNKNNHNHNNSYNHDHKNDENLQILHHEMKESMLLLNMIVEIFGKVVEARDLNESLLNILLQLGQYIRFNQGILLIKDEQDSNDYFKVFGHYGFENEVEKKQVLLKEDSLVYCARDIGSSLIVSDLINDCRFNEHELFPVKEKLSVIAKCISFNGVVHALFLFYTPEKESFLLRNSLDKIDKVVSIILPNLQVRMNIEKELRKIEAEKDEERKWAQSLLQIVGHDISNPLVIIRGMSMMAEKKCPDCPNKAKLWGTVVRATNTIEEIINSVRIMQSLKMNKVSLELTKTNLAETIEKAKFVFEEKLKNKQLQIVYQNCSNEEEVSVLTDKLSFSNEVINNLISNAIKFSFQNSTIHITSEIIHDDQVHIKISDNGIGMPENILNNIFDARTKTSRKGTLGEHGTGFGMPLVKNFIDLYKGQISVESKDIEQFPDNHGSIIHLYLKKA